MAEERRLSSGNIINTWLQRRIHLDRPFSSSKLIPALTNSNNR